MYYKKHIFLLAALIFFLGMEKEETLPQKTMSNDPDKNSSNTNVPSLKLTHPRDLIDPKTGKPYKIVSDAWDEFWHKAFIRDQILENLTIQAYLRQKK